MPMTRSRGKPRRASRRGTSRQRLVTTMRWRRGTARPAHDGGHDAGVLRDEVVSAHARLAGQAGGHDDDLAAGRVGVPVRAGDLDVVADDRGGLGEVERLALRQALDDVHEDYVGQAGFDDPWAAVAPTSPAPMTVTLRRSTWIMEYSSPCDWDHGCECGRSVGGGL